MTIYLGENIKRLRREQNLTQETLAEFLGVTFQSISKWERGESYPDITLLPALASFFKVSTDELLGVNKSQDEEEIKRLEELSRLEEKRREEELRERRRIEEIRALKNQMSPELCEAVEEEEENGGFDSYDDFSTEPAENKESVPVKKFGVVFDPAVFSGDEYIEKLGCDISEDAESAQNYAEKLTESTAEADETAVEKNTGKKKKRKR